MNQNALGADVGLISLTWDSDAWVVGGSAHWIIFLVVLVAVGGIFVFKVWHTMTQGAAYEIDRTEIGIGDTKFSLKPNFTDRQVAYAIWVELSTRKIGLPIDLEHDVISEIYDSWYNYFSVTRDLIKTISVSRVRSKSTQQIINLSIDVLNEGLRPHLTTWQARYRFWYKSELKSKPNGPRKGMIDPQSIQRSYPKFEELSTDLLHVNKGLIAYRKAMRDLVFS